MKSFFQYITLFLLVFAGFLISGALTPPIPEGSIKNSDGLETLPAPATATAQPRSPPLPAPLSLALGSAVDLSPSSRKLLGSDDR